MNNPLKSHQPKPKASPKTSPDSLNVKIYSPFKVYFDGLANSISAVNDTGPFDILPRHHNFLTLLKEGEVTLRKASGETRYKIARGVMHVRDNNITVFLDV